LGNFRKNTNLAIYIKQQKGLTDACLIRIEDKIDHYVKKELQEAFDSIFNAFKRLYEEIKNEDFPEDIDF